MSLKSPLMRQIRKSLQLAANLCDLFEHEPLSGLVAMLAEDLMALSEGAHRSGTLDIGATVRLMKDIKSLFLRLSPNGKDLGYSRLQPIEGYLERLEEIKAVESARRRSQLDLVVRLLGSLL
jgi:hypothetical protein